MNHTSPPPFPEIQVLKAKHKFPQLDAIYKILAIGLLAFIAYKINEIEGNRHVYVTYGYIKIDQGYNNPIPVKIEQGYNNPVPVVIK